MEKRGVERADVVTLHAVDAALAEDADLGRHVLLDDVDDGLRSLSREVRVMMLPSEEIGQGFEQRGEVHDCTFFPKHDHEQMPEQSVQATSWAERG